MLCRNVHIDLEKLIPDCVFHARTGYYCFGCGGTRAVRALLQGRIIESMSYHIFPVYVTLVMVVFLISCLASFLSKGRVRALRLRPVYGYILIVLIVAQCIVKNWVKYKWGIGM